MSNRVVISAIVAAFVGVARADEPVTPSHDRYDHKHHPRKKKHHHKHKDKSGKVVDVVDDSPGGELVACVTDCACVLAYCPVGDRSCTACWWYEHTNVSCTPDLDEQAAYGNTCPAR